MKPVIQRVLGAQNPPTTMERIFPDYTEANYFLAYANQVEFRTAPFFGLGMDYRPARDERHDLSDQNPRVIGPRAQYGGRTVQYLGAAYVEFHNDFRPKNLGRGLRVQVDIFVDNPSTPPVVKLWIITQAAPPATNLPRLVPPVQLVSQVGPTRRYVAQATIPNFDRDNYQWVALMLTNPQMAGSSLRNWSYRADVIPPTPIPTPTATPTATPMLTVTRTPTR